MSTAKSMATLYLNGKRQSAATNKSSTLSTQRNFKSSASNLSMTTNRNSTLIQSQSQPKSRLKATSMTNLLAGSSSALDESAGNSLQATGSQQSASRIQRPVSRNALDSIHNGMNAKYAQVQSKVYLQHIRPQASANGTGSGAASKIPASGQQLRTAARSSKTLQPGGQLSGATKANAAATAAGERAALAAKLKSLEEELAAREAERDHLSKELERERAEKSEQLEQLKGELQEKLSEHDKQNEEYHRKLLEAYELADQNRKAADSVLSESRQRDEDARKRIDELESQLGELKEFVQMKEEMTGKMFELREQLRQERERYEEQLKSLHQIFENEKISQMEEIQLGYSQQQDGADQLASVSPSQRINQLDRMNSNYFNRIKPALESNESIDKIAKPYTTMSSNLAPTANGQVTLTVPEVSSVTGSRSSIRCSKCQSGSSQLHKSEQDIYGSKVSTRVQDTARSAWRASKQFASSVITGGVGGLSACRQCTRRQPSPAPTRSKKAAAAAATVNGQPQAPMWCAPTSGELEQNGPTSGEQHTSVIKLDHSLANGNSNNTEAAEENERKELGQATSGLIRVDENNKLTIVTKFNQEHSVSAVHSSGSSSDEGSDQSGSGSSNTTNLELGASHNNGPVSSTGSERSRCESSSSGRGTSASDAGSSASQNGDDDLHQSRISQLGFDQQKPPAAVIASSGGQLVVAQQKEGEKTARGHRRRSSLFKASKVFGGSQVSLNKIKSLFSASGKPVAGGRQQEAEAAATCLSIEHLESSRLRCMELNMKLNQSATEVAVDPVSETTAAAKQDEDKPETEEMVNANGISDTNENKDKTTTDKQQELSISAQGEGKREEISSPDSGNDSNNNSDHRGDKSNFEQLGDNQMGRPMEAQVVTLRLAAN